MKDAATDSVRCVLRLAAALAIAGIGLGFTASCTSTAQDENEQPSAGSLGAGNGGQGGMAGSLVSAGTTAGSAAGSGTGGNAGTAGSDAGNTANAGTSAGTGAGASGASAGEAGSSSDAAVSDASTPLPTLPPVTSVDTDGPFAVDRDLATGPSSDSGLFYPTELGKDGLAHPILLWGCGGSSTPSSYAEHMSRIASHGFVALAVISMIGDDGDVLTANLDWLLAENERADSLLFGQLDATNIAAGGHSIGSVNTFLMATDPRLRTTIHVAGGSLDNVNDPFAPTTGMGGKALVHPTALISAETDVFGNVEKLEKDYETATAPIYFTKITGADHIGAARDGLPVIVAWLRWHLGAESERSQMFLEADGELRTGNYVSQIKNW